MEFPIGEVTSRAKRNAAIDFTPVSLIFDMPLVLTTRKDFPANNLQEFIAYARANQGTMQYGSSGVGGTGHLACALLNAAGPTRELIRIVTARSSGMSRSGSVLGRQSR